MRVGSDLGVVLLFHKTVQVKNTYCGFSCSLLACLVIQDFRNLKKMLNIAIQMLKLSFSYVFITDTQSSHAKLYDRHEKHNVFTM